MVRRPTASGRGRAPRRRAAPSVTRAARLGAARRPAGLRAAPAGVDPNACTAQRRRSRGRGPRCARGEPRGSSAGRITVVTADHETRSEIVALIEATYRALSTPGAAFGEFFDSPDISVAGSGVGELFTGPEAAIALASDRCVVGVRLDLRDDHGLATRRRRLGTGCRDDPRHPQRLRRHRPVPHDRSLRTRERTLAVALLGRHRAPQPTPRLAAHLSSVRRRWAVPFASSIRRICRCRPAWSRGTSRVWPPVRRRLESEPR